MSQRMLSQQGTSPVSVTSTATKNYKSKLINFRSFNQATQTGGLPKFVAVKPWFPLHLLQSVSCPRYFLWHMVWGCYDPLYANLNQANTSHQIRSPYNLWLGKYHIYIYISYFLTPAQSSSRCGTAVNSKRGLRPGVIATDAVAKICTFHVTANDPKVLGRL